MSRVKARGAERKPHCGREAVWVQGTALPPLSGVESVEKWKPHCGRGAVWVQAQPAVRQVDAVTAGRLHFP